MQLDPVAYIKGGASGGGGPQAQQHTFHSNLKACLNAIARWTLCALPWPPALLPRCDSI